MQENIIKLSSSCAKTTDIQFELEGKQFSFNNRKGLYSKARFEAGIKYFLETLLSYNLSGTNLDFNCKIGVCGITLANFKKSEFFLYDEDSSALEIAKLNVEKYNLQSRVKIVDSNNFEKVEYRFDHAFFTPPEKLKKDKLFDLYNEIHKQLDNGGSLFLLLPIKEGALTSMKYLENIFRSVAVLDHYKGYQILKCIK